MKFKQLVTMAKKAGLLTVVVSTAVLLSACKEQEIVSPQEFSGTENGAFTKSGRFFYTANLDSTTRPNAIVEITKEEGEYKNTVILEGIVGGTPCSFNGMTAYKNNLYASCTFIGMVPDIPFPVPTHSVMIQIELDKAEDDPTRVQIAPLLGFGGLPNGMAADKQGNIYVTDSASWTTTYGFGIPNFAIVKVGVSNNGAFSTDVQSWYEPDLGDAFPNGIRIRKNKVFFVTGSQIKRFDINEDGSAGAFTEIYTADVCNIIDDFDITHGDYIVATQVALNDPAFMANVWPGVDCSATLPQGRLIGISGKGMGEKLGEYVFQEGTLPSSAVFAKGRLFEPYSVITTAFFTGGVQKVSLD